MLRSALLAIALSLIHAAALQAQVRGEEISYFTKANTAIDPAVQQELRASSAWRTFVTRHPKWSVEFAAHTGLPRRAYGPPVVVEGATPVERAQRFFRDELTGYAIPLDEFVHRSTVEGKITYVHFTQQHEGLAVFGSHAMVKLDGQGRVISFTADAIPVQAFPSSHSSGVVQAERALQGLADITAWEHDGSCWVAAPNEGSLVLHQAHRIIVHTKGTEIPGRFLCLVHAVTGELLYRANAIASCGPPVSASVNASGEVYTGSPLVAPEVRFLPNVRATIGSTTYHADENGMINAGESGPVSATFELRSPWAKVSTLNVTPSFTTTLNEGANAINFNSATTIQQRSAYRYVWEMRQHLAVVLPAFTGLNYEMPVRVDLVSPNCNGFYDGDGINFYEQGNNCRSLATIDDVVYHEYAHGINDKYYESLGSTFTNGAMDEGYADVWALSLAEDLVFGEAVRIDFAGSAIRRYDGAPRVYPVDILGDRHNDGQVIAGAWMDLYQLLGNDMPLMLQLFKEAYGGLQAIAPNGDEGRAFRDVLLDVLQADDDDGDITNGTPNGDVIIEAFARHGITLISDIQIHHEELFSANASEDIEVYALVDATFPSTAYMEEVVLRYRINAEQIWNEVPMVMGDASHAGIIPAQIAGTIVHYHIAVRDLNGRIGAVDPAGAQLIDPRLSHSILVGLESRGVEDADLQSAFGPWTFGQPGDNAIRGLWAEGVPVPSYSNSFDVTTIAQPGTQHTVGGSACWFTGNATSATAPVGEQDVDVGSTSLVSPLIDLSMTNEPVISYWRWYTNAPPTGTVPNQDLWQVFASSDGGGSWIAVEETRRSERAWRRNAFRVVDVLGDVTSIRLKFVASDTLVPNSDLGGGSIVEAALDDLELWDTDFSSALHESAAQPALTVWPVPADDVLYMRAPSASGTITYQIIDMTGRLVGSGQQVSIPGTSISVTGLSSGNYLLRAKSGDHFQQVRFSVVHGH